MGDPLGTQGGSSGGPLRHHGGGGGGRRPYDRDGGGKGGKGKGNGGKAKGGGRGGGKGSGKDHDGGKGGKGKGKGGKGKGMGKGEDGPTSKPAPRPAATPSTKAATTPKIKSTQHQIELALAARSTRPEADSAEFRGRAKEFKRAQNAWVESWEGELVEDGTSRKDWWKWSKWLHGQLVAQSQCAQTDS